MRRCAWGAPLRALGRAGGRCAPLLCEEHRTASMGNVGGVRGAEPGCPWFVAGMRAAHSPTPGSPTPHRAQLMWDAQRGRRSGANGEIPPRVQWKALIHWDGVDGKDGKGLPHCSADASGRDVAEVGPWDSGSVWLPLEATSRFLSTVYRVLRFHPPHTLGHGPSKPGSVLGGHTDGRGTPGAPIAPLTPRSHRAHIGTTRCGWWPS